MVSREAIAHGARALVACIIAALIILPSLRDLLGVSVAGSGPIPVAAVAWSGVQHVVPAIAGIGLLFSILEFGVARAQWLKKLRMSFDEFKREMKEQDGDPLARGRRKSMHRALIRGSLKRVKDAAFVVVNPTHVAIALEYRPPEVPVPVVLVRAADEAALRVREVAAEHRIPVIENVPLARALFADCHAGRAIPTGHYVAVAEVVAALVRSGALA
jgi:flagellar biosynthesis protein FlhB